MLRIISPPGCESERRYVAEVVFGDFLGLEYRFEVNSTSTQWRLELDGAEGGIEINDAFFAGAGENWLLEQSLPSAPFSRFRRPDGNELAVLFGDSFEGGEWWLESAGNVLVGIDLLGSIFFLLSRYEEAVVKDCDAHERFQFENSAACVGGFVEIPIVDEYVALLKRWISGRWPGVGFRRHEFEVTATHDVDVPFSRENPRTFKRLARFSGRALISEKKPVAALKVACGFALHALSKSRVDPFHNFDWIASECEKAGVPGAFYFIARDSGGPLEGEYAVDEPGIRDLISMLVKRGHEIGLHGCYHSSTSSEWLGREREKISGISGLPVSGGRQHFLRWRTPESFRAWDGAGLSYDSTLGFAERAGFRCGTSRDFPVYDVEERRKLSLRERPLIAMEATVIDPYYMGLSNEDAADKFKLLKDRCREFGGRFVFLWHNNRLLDEQSRELYRFVLSC